MAFAINSFSSGNVATYIVHVTISAYDILYPTYFSLARGSPRSKYSRKATAITNNYQESRKQSEKSSKRCSYSIKIINRNIIGNQIGNRTIKVSVTIKRKLNIFCSRQKHQYFIIYAKAQVY